MISSFDRTQFKLSHLAVIGLSFGCLVFLNGGASFSPRPDLTVQETSVNQKRNQDSTPIVLREDPVSSIKLDYLKTSAPVYPMLARKHGWQGTVVLKVLVKGDGSCAQVRVEQSSGHAALDESAVEAVKKWKFSPARLGNSSYTSLAQVPIRFVLAEHDIRQL